jgi:methylamine--corrinoid protein Co-methyltransferase
MESLFHECAAMATLASVCGASRVLGVRSAVGVAQDHCTGLEARFNGEVAHAAAGLTREAAEELIRRALDEYEAILGTKPTGRPFGELYDKETLQPRPDWERQYETAKERVSRWGLPL